MMKHVIFNSLDLLVFVKNNVSNRYSVVKAKKFYVNCCFT